MRARLFVQAAISLVYTVIFQIFISDFNSELHIALDETKTLY